MVWAMMARGERYKIRSRFRRRRGRAGLKKTKSSVDLITAFARGLSGPGMLVIEAKRVNALRPGDSVRSAWSNVGQYLDHSFAKLSSERKQPRQQ